MIDEKFRKFYENFRNVGGPPHDAPYLIATELVARTQSIVRYLRSTALWYHCHTAFARWLSPIKSDSTLPSSAQEDTMSRTGTATAIGILTTLIVTITPILAIAQPPCNEIDPPLLVPESDVCPGWVTDGEMQTAYTYEELTDVINGAAHLYEQYGFVAAAFQNYLGEVGEEVSPMTLSVFNQGTAANAEALYDDMNSGSGDPVDDWGGTGDARMRIAFGTVSFQFWENCFFVGIVVVVGGEAAVPHARCFADEIVGRIQDPTPVEPQTWGGLKLIYR